jgi:hypothetical protein
MMFRLETPWWMRLGLVVIALPSLIFAHFFSAWLIAALLAGSVAAVVSSYIGGRSE